MESSIVSQLNAQGTNDGRYDVTFFDHRISTLVTHSPSHVSSWLSQLPPPPLLVGLDVEWRPNITRYSNHPVATIQLCAVASTSTSTCLIFQIIHAPHVPPKLTEFLSNLDNRFVGVGIREDAKKLRVDYGLKVGNVVDLRVLAGERMKNAGLKTLAMEILGKEVKKPKTISRSRWDDRCLTLAQVEYACLDAFLSLEIGRTLIATVSPSIALAALTSGMEALTLKVEGGGGPTEPNGSSQGGATAKKKPTCDYCGKYGHSRSKCWHLHGYPKWYDPKRQQPQVKGKRAANAWRRLPRKSSRGPDPQRQQQLLISPSSSSVSAP
ncbi:hypothetical protein SAY86_022577 [Trapa natans]|uniref:3'-5' exonuclease domain-containing protein n=1 Tax=Trapa natans TaxID=22666 RepID=A0AAN7M5G6_TRANT|nr:hypothetical protein SAY86_022577 [Trapa natans]